MPSDESCSARNQHSHIILLEDFHLRPHFPFWIFFPIFIEIFNIGISIHGMPKTFLKTINPPFTHPLRTGFSINEFTILFLPVLSSPYLLRGWTPVTVPIFPCFL